MSKKQVPEAPVIEPLRVGVVDAAKLIGIGQTRMREHIKAGKIRTVRDGDRVLITMEELRRYVAQDTAAQSAEAAA